VTRDGGKPDASELFGKRARFLGLEIQAADVLILAVFALFTALTILFHGRILYPWRSLAKNCACAILYLGAVYAYPRVSSRFLRFFLRTGSVQIAFAYLYLASLPLQLIFVRNWQDAVVLRLEQAVFGFQPTLWLQKFVSPALTEWMMFCYVTYVVLYPVLSGLIFYKRGERAMEHYLFALVLTNVICDLGFLVFPIAGPLYYMPRAYAVPLKGHAFTFLGEYIRTHVHQIGGNLPSPHAALASVMWIMAYRYFRPGFYIMAPVILSLYVSTFYGRYHYLTDAVVGILTGILAILCVPSIMAKWNLLVRRRATGAT
jgi:membrane-associated phospholipid phosphatase